MIFQVEVPLAVTVAPLKYRWEAPQTDAAARRVCWHAGQSRPPVPARATESGVPQAETKRACRRCWR